MAVFHSLSDDDMFSWTAVLEDPKFLGPRANGSDVLLTGIVTRPDLESESGTVVCYDPNNAAYIITLIMNGTFWMVSEDNLIDDPAYAK